MGQAIGWPLFATISPTLATWSVPRPKRDLINPGVLLTEFRKWMAGFNLVLLRTVFFASPVLYPQARSGPTLPDFLEASGKPNLPVIALRLISGVFHGRRYIHLGVRAVDRRIILEELLASRMLLQLLVLCVFGGIYTDRSGRVCWPSFVPSAFQTVRAAFRRPRLGDHLDRVVGGLGGTPRIGPGRLGRVWANCCRYLRSQGETQNCRCYGSRRTPMRCPWSR